MNRLVLLAGFIAAGGMACSVTAGQAVPYAVVDMDAVIQQHPDTATAESILKKQADEYEAERTSMLEEAQGVQAELELLMEEAESLALSDAGRLQKRRAAEDLVLRIRDIEREVKETTAQRQKELTDRRRRMRKRIVQDIEEVIKAYAKEENILLILEKHSAAQGGVNMVIYYDRAIDVTEAIAGRVQKLRE